MPPFYLALKVTRKLVTLSLHRGTSTPSIPSIIIDFHYQYFYHCRFKRYFSKQNFGLMARFAVLNGLGNVHLVGEEPFAHDGSLVRSTTVISGAVRIHRLCFSLLLPSALQCLQLSGSYLAPWRPACLATGLPLLRRPCPVCTNSFSLSNSCWSLFRGKTTLLLILH